MILTEKAIYGAGKLCYNKRSKRTLALSRTHCRGLIAARTSAIFRCPGAAWRNCMAHASFDKESIKQSIIGKIQRYNGRTLADATPQQIYYAVASTIRDQIMEKWVAARERDKT